MEEGGNEGRALFELMLQLNPKGTTLACWSFYQNDLLKTGKRPPTTLQKIKMIRD
jgi:hypothetical protein